MLTVGMHDLRGLFQPKWFYDSMIQASYIYEFIVQNIFFQ